jgi:diguanylate cyclase (GGDEF)-like protein
LAAVALVALGTAAGAPGGPDVWPPAPAFFETCALILASLVTAACARLRPRIEDWATMPPTFVPDIAALLLLGPREALIVTATGAVTRVLTDEPEPRLGARMLATVGTSLLAVEAAAFTHLSLGGEIRHFQWPWQGLPIAAALLSYCFVASAAAEAVRRLLAQRPVATPWPHGVLRGYSSYVIGGTVAVGLVEVVDHRLWAVVPAIAVSLYFMYGAYRDFVFRRQRQHDDRCDEVLDALEQGVAVVDDRGVVMRWNRTLERLLRCPADRAVGRPLIRVMPLLADTALPRLLQDAADSSRVQLLPGLGLPGADGARMFEVRIVPGSDGLTLHWRDVTPAWQAERRSNRSEERLALVADGANDGLWEWDLRSGEFYASARWHAMVGAAGAGGVCTPDVWLDRVHPDDAASLRAALDAHIAGTTESVQHEHRIRVHGETYRWFLCRGVAVRAPGLRTPRIAGSLTDTTEHALLKEQARHAGTIDPLTGLCNRAVFVERLGQRLEDLKSRRRGPFATLYLDLDRFKVVNDSLGHLVGDELLVVVSRRLERCLRPGDVLARLGGDEFGILLNELADETQANAVALRIQDAFKTPFAISGREVFTSVSMGVAFGWGHYNNPEDVMRDADTAMYHAKSRGKARHELFDADMHARVQNRLDLENDLRRAIDRQDLEVHYQPIVCLETGRCVGFESLVRWTRNGKPVSPATFIPIAEELGLIEPLGTWVLQQACTTFADWRRRFPHSDLDHMTVNVSSRQLVQQNLLWTVEQAIERAGMDPEELRLEITETAIMDSPAEAARMLQQLRDLGVMIYLDDFGTGYSSLSHLHKLPVDALKIDRSFVSSLLLPERPAIVESILALARTLDTSVVAEGIENDEQAEELERLGCTHAQGFLFSRPLSSEAAEDVLRANRPLGPKGARDANRLPAPSSDLFFSSSPFEAPETAPEGALAPGSTRGSSRPAARVLSRPAAGANWFE